MAEHIKDKLNKIYSKYDETYETKDYKQISRDIITLYNSSKLKFLNDPYGKMSLISLQT